MAEQRNGPKAGVQRDVGRQINVGVFLIRPPRPLSLRDKGTQVLVGRYDRVRGAHGGRRAWIVGVVISPKRIAGLPRLGPHIVGLRRMNARARVQVHPRVRDLSADTRRAVGQAVDERRCWIQKDLLWAGYGAWLRPVVILHRDHEDLLQHTLITVAAVRVDGNACPSQRTG